MCNWVSWEKFSPLETSTLFLLWYSSLRIYVEPTIILMVTLGVFGRSPIWMLQTSNSRGNFPYFSRIINTLAGYRNNLIAGVVLLKLDHLNISVEHDLTRSNCFCIVSIGSLYKLCFEIIFLCSKTIYLPKKINYILSRTWLFKKSQS